MAKATPSPAIIDLTEIVEPGPVSASRPAKPEAGETLGSYASDLMGGSTGDDVELDDLLAQLNDGELGAGASRVVNPDESLNMPGMDDMDALFGEIDKKAQKPQKPASAAVEPAEVDLDALFAGIDAPKPKAEPVSTVTPAVDELDGLLDGLLDAPTKAAQPAVADDLDSLLDGLMDTPKTSGQASGQVSGKTAPLKNDDLDSLLDELATNPASEAKQNPSSSGKIVNDDELDALFAQLDGPLDAASAVTGAVSAAEAASAAEIEADSETSRAAPNVVPDAAPNVDIADLPADAVPQARTNRHEDALNSLLEGLDVPLSGPMGRADADAATDTVDVASLDALLAKGPGSLPEAADVAVPSVPAAALHEVHDELSVLRDEVRQTAEELRTVLGEHGAIRQAVLELQEARGQDAPQPDMLGAVAGRLDVLEMMAAPLAEFENLTVRVTSLESQLAQPSEAGSDALGEQDAQKAAWTEAHAELTGRLEALEALEALEEKTRSAAEHEELKARLESLEIQTAQFAQSSEPASDKDAAWGEAYAALSARMDAVESLLPRLDVLETSVTTHHEAAEHESGLAEMIERVQSLESAVADAVQGAERTLQSLESRMDEAVQAQSGELDAVRTAVDARMAEAVEQIQSDVSARLDACAPSAPADLDQLAVKVLELLRPEIERAAAAAAAKIIREEISALLAAEED